MNGQQIALVLDKQIDSLPKVSGGEPYLSRETNEVFQKATQYSKDMGDEFVSLEPILLALLNVKKYRLHYPQGCRDDRHRQKTHLIRDRDRLFS